MKRSLFFIITAIIGVLFGALLFLAPAKGADGFGVEASPIVVALFRALGAMILGMGIMNFLVRNHPASPTLKAVLLTNIFSHGLTMIADISGVIAGTLQFSKIAVGQGTHIFIGIGSLIYLLKMEKTS